MDDGRGVASIRVDWEATKPEDLPEEVDVNGKRRDGYGYFHYQTESRDGGRSWAPLRRLPIWGHPAFLLRLRDGGVLMVYGHRRPPFSVRAVVSRDGTRTWDPDRIVTLHELDTPGADIGYPVATQLDDGTVLCAFYGYTTADNGGKSPHGISAVGVPEAALG